MTSVARPCLGEDEDHQIFCIFVLFSKFCGDILKKTLEGRAREIVSVLVFLCAPENKHFGFMFDA